MDFVTQKLTVVLVRPSNCTMTSIDVSVSGDLFDGGVAQEFTVVGINGGFIQLRSTNNRCLPVMSEEFITLLKKYGVNDPREIDESGNKIPLDLGMDMSLPCGEVSKYVTMTGGKTHR